MRPEPAYGAFPTQSLDRTFGGMFHGRQYRPDCVPRRPCTGFVADPAVLAQIAAKLMIRKKELAVAVHEKPDYDQPAVDRPPASTRGDMPVGVTTELPDDQRMPKQVYPYNGLANYIVVDRHQVL